MKTLFLAPQPFFQDRGTPIAVRLAVRVLAEQENNHVDLLTYREGEDSPIENINHIRMKAPGFLKNVRPGISFKKLLCDIFFTISALKQVKIQKDEQYTIVHAVEESVFIAMLIKLIWKIPYIYDMDSSVAQQLTEKWTLLKPLLPIFSFIEALAIRRSAAVIPVCDALADIAKKDGAKEIQVLRDISMLDLDPEEPDTNKSLKEEAGIPEGATVVLYVGNLEPYQGIGLLLEAHAKSMLSNTHIVIIGGNEKDIKDVSDFAEELGIKEHVHFLGSRPVSQLKHYLQQADILSSPRMRGNNTPMKIYSYLHSGKAILATDLPTHTQVLNNEVAYLCKPTVVDYAAGLTKLVNSPALRAQLGEAANKLAEEKYTFKVFKESLNKLYKKLDSNSNK